MKRVIRKISDVILIFVLCLTLFLTAITPIAFAVGGTVFTDCLKSVGSQAELDDDAYKELVLAYADFYSDLGQGDFMAALVDGVVDIPLSWFSVTTEAFTDVASAFVLPKDTLVMHPAGYDDLLYFLNDLGKLVVYDNRGGGGGRVRDVEVTDDARIDGDTFSKICTQLLDHYGPKNTADYISWRTDKRLGKYTQGRTSPALSWFYEGSFCGHSDWQEVYMVPFYTNGVDRYYSGYQLHFYQAVEEDANGDSIICLYMEYWNMLSEQPEKTTVLVSNTLKTNRYIDLGQFTEARVFFYPYSNYAAYLDCLIFNNFYSTVAASNSLGVTTFLRSDMLSTLECHYGMAHIQEFQISVAEHDASCANGSGCDIGYNVSNKPIEMDFSGVDFTQFTADDTVTLSGDTIYDYIITNNTTGDSTTVNNYITNNYNYPDNGTGDSGEEDSGSASGNVNVSGNIDVGGSVDVNVNVNTNGSADGGSMPVDVDLNNYLEQTPEQAKPITEFFSIFFDFLPPELLGLICLGVAVAIILRIWGR